MNNPTNQTEKPVALVTGGGTGIGAACCRQLAAEGFRVLVHYRGSAESAKALATEISENGADAIALQADLSDSAQVEQLIAQVKKEVGRLDVLVNNAGYNVNAPSSMMKLDDYDRVMALGRGSWYLSKLVLRRFMLRSKTGRIITISSVVGHTGNAGQVPYTMVKAGLDAMTKSLAAEVAGTEIRINSVAPGFIETEMTDELPEEMKTSLLANVPVGRIGRADEIADTVGFLATRGSYIHGTVLHVNGGLYGG